MMKIKLLRSRYYSNIDDNTTRNVKESGEYYINQDLERFCYKNPDVKILDVNLVTDRYSGIIIVIKYEEDKKLNGHVLD